MIRAVARRLSFDQLAITFTLSVVILLYALAAGGPLRPAALRWAAAPAPQDDARTAAAAPAADRDLPLIRYVTGAAHDAAQAALTSRTIADIFASIGYRLDTVRANGEVPRVFMASLPRDLAALRVPARRKQVFIKTALPLILHVNELIAHDRARIERLRAAAAAGIGYSGADAAWLKRTAADYGLDKVDFAALLRRVDIVPPSMALAQSAEESGWGTSRFAQNGNALFGQRTWRAAHSGLVPHRRADGEGFRVAAFDQLMDGVKAYVRNLNSHPAYAAFRRLRAAERAAGDGLDGYALAGTLVRYSERGADYVQALRAIIRGNDLDAFDDVRLADHLYVQADASPDA